MPIDYTKHPDESIQQYNARIAAANPNLPAPGTTSPTGITNSALPGLPQGGGATQPQLPGSTDSPILSFASALDAAVNLARKSRNASSLEMMKGHQGTVAASDFNSILGNLNAASDKTAQNLIKNVTPGSSASDIVTTTNDSGDVTAIDKTSGKVLWTAKGVGNKQSAPGDKGITDTQLKQFINSQIATPEFQALSPDEQSLYIRAQGGTPYDFGF